MEPIVDFGLFEILALLGLAGLSRDARRHVRARLTRAAAKLGRCVRCMTLTALGLAASLGAIVWLGSEGSRVLRMPVYVIAFGFGLLAVLHILALVYRTLSRLEARVAKSVGGCNCTGPASRAERSR